MCVVSPRDLFGLVFRRLPETAVSRFKVSLLLTATKMVTFVIPSMNFGHTFLFVNSVPSLS